MTAAWISAISEAVIASAVLITLIGWIIREAARQAAGTELRKTAEKFDKLLDEKIQKLDNLYREQVRTSWLEKALSFVAMIENFRHQFKDHKSSKP